MLRLALLVLLSAWLCCAVEAKQAKPLRTIAPDLIVQSLDFGRFEPGRGPADGIQPKDYKFTPLSSNVATQPNGDYGYRLIIKTKRKKIRIFQTVDPPFNLKPLKPKKGDGEYVTPSNGAIYGEWPMDGIKNGKYSVYLWVEDAALPKLDYTVRF